MRCNENLLRRNSQMTAISVRSSKLYTRRCPSRAGMTRPRSSHHCNWRAVMPVRRMISRDVKVFCTRSQITVQTFSRKNVSNIVGTSCEEAMGERVEKGLLKSYLAFTFDPRCYV